MNDHLQPLITHCILTLGAPTLASIHLRAISLHCCLPPVTQITSIHLHQLPRNMMPTFSEMHSVLSGLPHLKELAVHGEITQGWPSHQAPYTFLLCMHFSFVQRKIPRKALSLVSLLLYWHHHNNFSLRIWSQWWICSSFLVYQKTKPGIQHCISSGSAKPVFCTVD